MKTKRIGETDISRFHGDADLSAGKMRGIYILETGHQCKYSLSIQQTTAAYRVRGTITLLDPRSGKILKVKAPDNSQTIDGQESHKKRMVVARVPVYARETDGESLRCEIAKRTRALFEENVLLIYDSTAKTVPVDQMLLPVAVEIFGNKYINNKSRSAQAQHTHMLHLRKVAEMLSAATVSGISLRMVDGMCKEIGSNWRVYVQAASDFLDFVHCLKPNSNSENAFKDYLDRHPTNNRKNIHKLQADAANTDILAPAEEDRLNQEILSHIDNGIYMGIVLIKDAGLSAVNACNIVWGDLAEMNGHPDRLCLQYQRDEVSGAVHDYTFPLSRFACEVLLQRKTWVESRSGKKKIDDLPVVTARDQVDVALRSSELTAACRNILRSYGVGYAALAAMRDYEEGAGVRILLNTYKNRLEEICNLRMDPALVAFLMHYSLGSMLQASSYRSFTDQCAMEMIAAILDRNKRFSTGFEHTASYRRKKTKGGERFVVYAKRPRDKAHATVRLRLQPGMSLSVCAPHGCRVALTANRLN